MEVSVFFWVGRFFFRSLQFDLHFPHAVAGFVFVILTESLSPLPISWYCRDASISAFRSVACDDEKVFQL